MITADVSNQRPTTYLTALYGYVGASSQYKQTFYVSRMNVSGDSEVSVTSPTLAMPYAVTPVSFDGTVIKEKRVKYGYLNVFAELGSDDLAITTYVDGKVLGTTETLVFPADANKDPNFLMKFKTPGFARRLGVRINGSLTQKNIVVATTISPVEIKAIHILFNTSRSEEKVSGG